MSKDSINQEPGLFTQDATAPAPIARTVDSVEGARYVSNRVNVVIAVSATIALASVALCIAFAQSLFPDKEPISLDIWAFGSGSSRAAAIADFNQSKTKVWKFLDAAGISETSIHDSDFAIGQDQSAPREWDASQKFTVNGTSYAFFSHLSNDVSKIDSKGKRISASFPPIPFQGFAVWVGILTILTLCMSVASLEFRRSKVNAAPRGMHSLVIFVQSVMYALAIIAALTYVHLNALIARGGFAVISVCIVLSISFWLLRTKRYWNQSAFLQRAYAGYGAGAISVAIALVVSIARGPQ